MPSEQAVDVAVSVADWMRAHGIEVPSDLATKINELKSRRGWERIIWDDVREFYYEEQSLSDFVDSMAATIETQLTRAWNEGMRNNGLDPARDMTAEWQSDLQAIIDEEYNHVLDLAQAVEDARRDGRPVSQLRARTELWPARYDDVVNRAMIATKPDDLFVWVLGATEQHCATCAALNGWIATGQEWEDSKYHPQQPPNSELECGGWRCDCVMQRVTDKQARSMGVPSV
jgi:hypothetical protein